MKLSFTLAAAVAASLLGQPAFAAPATTPVEALTAGTLPTGYAQFRRFGHRHHGFRRGYGYRRGYGRGYGYRRGPGVGAAVGAGVAGLAAGAIIGGAIANSQAQAAQGSEAVAACARRFRSYDASSGTYLGNDGDRHTCP
ncbi:MULTISPECIES: BA14K family protein [unclassified Methylobacterium]|uniref:BA14K family protein n=1 Tax=unclassified Methylobacterium TaxID=2615210 RepID=UPI0011C9E972|nr:MULTISPECIES: BA14K family protein [unclassified Methylobacterium]TXM72784.1 BA14K family protein [Methylobacterium sp. WL12]TXN17347.1 BA14K family protein [Methylobacterium sp. WL122]TXN81278.1 BA14K family protein [Methylobacterium sp. WL8]